MRKLIALSLFFSLFLILSQNASACNPITDNCSTVSDFSNWTIKEGFGVQQISMNGSQIDLFVNGTDTSDGFALIRNNSITPIGLMATFDIKNMNGACRIGIRQYVGIFEGNYVEAQAYIQKYPDNLPHVIFRVRLQDTNNNNLRVLSIGEIGSSINYPNYQAITIAFARINSEVWFWTEGSDTIIKWKPTKEMGNINIKPEWIDAEKVGIDGYAEKGTGNFASATVRNINLLFNPTDIACLPLADNLDLNIPCAEFYGNKFGFTLNYSPLANDPLYWKLDINSFTVK